MSLSLFIQHIEQHFPQLWTCIQPNDITTVLLVQVKGTDVHPDLRNPNLRSKKTQVDITAPDNDPNLPKLYSLFPRVPNYKNLIYRSTHVFSPQNHQWIQTTVKSSDPNARPPSPGQMRIKLGGKDPNSWSSVLWSNIPENDFFAFVQADWGIPYSFRLEDHQVLRTILKTCGASTRSKVAFLEGRRHTAIPDSHFIYVVQNPYNTDWIKIGKTTREPIQRLKEYDVGPFECNMPYIRRTSDCHDAEREILSNIRRLNPPQQGQEWFQIPLELARRAIDAVVDNSYPHPNREIIHPIIRTVI